MTKVTVMFPSGMLGSGLNASQVARGIELGAQAIAIDAGSTDSGPYYLGAGVSKSPAAAIEHDLRILLTASGQAHIPVIVGSCGTSGTDMGVDWTAAIARKIAADHKLSFTLARIYSEQTAEQLAPALAAGRIRPLAPAQPLDEPTLRSCEHIVGLMGHDPIASALENGADIVLAGRASDASLVASLALLQGMPAGPAWHAAKTVECGDLCTTRPQGGGVLVEIDEGGFTVEPLDPAASCTPGSVAAHMLYENANPLRLTEPAGVLDTSEAEYASLDSRTVRVEGSRFEASEHLTIKLEGSAVTGYETIALTGIADPDVLAHVDAWTQALRARLQTRVRDLLDLKPNQYAMQIQCYGRDAVLGSLTRNSRAPDEVGIVLRVRASDQATATAIAQTANPLLLHLPAPGMKYLPSYAFLTSPAEIDRGLTYEFRLNHVVEVDSATELFRTQTERVDHG